ncbi:hypothetical protein RAN3_1879 [plant metagenome]|uniref:Uncharacterized protein n=1 Tax=plant metagenome TaxID=1297885 RepID=A0A484VBN2_9ZZZZ
MARASTTITVRLRFAWWLRWYLAGVALTARMSGLEPDANKVAGWVRRAARVQAVR